MISLFHTTHPHVNNFVSVKFVKLSAAGETGKTITTLTIPKCLKAIPFPFPFPIYSFRSFVLDASDMMC